MAIGKFLDPKTDIAFKRIFGTEKNKDILIDFLNDVLQKSGDSWIVDLEYLPTIQDPTIALLKTSAVDILCREQSGVRYIIEMQVTKTIGFEKRAQLYAAKAYCNQLNKGGKYETLKEVVFLALADHMMFPKKSDYRSEHVLLDKVTLENDLTGFSFTFIELPKFKKTLEECTSGMEKWFYFLIHAEESNAQDVPLYEDPMIAKAYGELNAVNWTEAELNTYDETQMQIMNARAALDYATREGELKVAKTLLEAGVSIDLILEKTGLPKELLLR
ncbi:MAG: Rpn family recombination-promoting nuclease/putative transposase [Pseudomonadota bacterium]